MKLDGVKNSKLQSSIFEGESGGVVTKFIILELNSKLQGSKKLCLARVISTIISNLLTLILQIWSLLCFKQFYDVWQMRNVFTLKGETVCCKYGHKHNNTTTTTATTQQQQTSFEIHLIFSTQFVASSKSKWEDGMTLSTFRVVCSSQNLKSIEKHQKSVMVAIWPFWNC